MKPVIQMKWLLVVVVVVVLGAVVLFLISRTGSQAASVPVTPKVQIGLVSEPNPPAVGESTLVISLKDETGKPINDARIKVQGDMEHAGMMPVSGDADTATNGEYRVPFEWSMGGVWIVTVTATLPDTHTFTQTFKLSVEAVSKNSVIHQGTVQPQTTPAH